MLNRSEELIAATLPTNEVSLLAGASGAGKTTLIMQVLSNLQRGELVFGREGAANLRIGYIAADRTIRAYEKTAKLVGLDMSKLKIKALVDDNDIDLRSFEASPIDELERLLKIMLPLDLVIVDPLIVFLGVDTNKYHLNASRLIRLNKFCLAHNLTILGTHHAAKARSDYGFKRAQDRISGTSALLGFTSTQLFLAHPDETGRKDGFYEWHVISHHAPGRVTLLSRGEAGLFQFEGEDALGQAKVEPSDLILDTLSAHQHPLNRRDLLFILEGEMSRSTLDRRLEELTKEGKVVQPSYGTYTTASQAATSSPIGRS